MLRRQWWIAAIAILAPSGIARAQTNGATEFFGRGITRVSDNGTTVHMNLRAETQGLLLRVSAQEVRVLTAGAFPAGESAVRIPSRPVELASATSSPGQYVDPATGVRIQQRQQSDCSTQGVSTSTDKLAAATRRAECMANTRAPESQPRQVTTVRRAPPREYLLLVLTDQPLDTADIVARLGNMPAFDRHSAAHDMAEHLVGQRSTVWAGYLARR